MALIIAILFSWLSSVDNMRISILFFVINNVAKSLKELVFHPPEWNCWTLWNMVASVGAKYILKYSERLGKQEPHLSANRWSLTNKKPPTFPYRLLCFPEGIPYSLQEAIIPYCLKVSGQGCGAQSLRSENRFLAWAPSSLNNLEVSWLKSERKRIR